MFAFMLATRRLSFHGFGHKGPGLSSSNAAASSRVVSRVGTSAACALPGPIEEASEERRGAPREVVPSGELATGSTSGGALPEEEAAGAVGCALCSRLCSVLQDEFFVPPPPAPVPRRVRDEM